MEKHIGNSFLDRCSVSTWVCQLFTPTHSHTTIPPDEDTQLRRECHCLKGQVGGVLSFLIRSQKAASSLLIPVSPGHFWN